MLTKAEDGVFIGAAIGVILMCLVGMFTIGPLPFIVILACETGAGLLGAVIGFFVGKGLEE